MLIIAYLHKTINELFNIYFDKINYPLICKNKYPLNLINRFLNISFQYSYNAL